MKCSICKQNERDYTWQPELDPAFYLPGSHIRGFMTVPICSECVEKVKSGETVIFTYKKEIYRGGLNSFQKVKSFLHISEPTEEDESPIYPDFESAWPALERGERVRIEMQPFEIDPWLVQKAIDLQQQERFEEWKNREE